MGRFFAALNQVHKILRTVEIENVSFFTFLSYSCAKRFFTKRKSKFLLTKFLLSPLFSKTPGARVYNFAKHCGYKSIMLFERAKDLCHMTLLALRLFHFHVNRLFTFGFFFRGIIRISEILTYMAKIIRFQANFLPLKCLDAKNNKGIYPLSCVISAW